MLPWHQFQSEKSASENSHNRINAISGIKINTSINYTEIKGYGTYYYVV